MTERNSILLIEDDERLAAVLDLHFADLGFQLLHAADGEQGLAMALKQRHALIILDVELPKLDGIEVCRKLREQNCDCPVLMLTSRSEEVDMVVGLKVGADDYVTKPFKLAVLMARVEALIRRTQDYSNSAQLVQESASIVIGALEIDATKRRVVLRDEELELTAREFDLLLFLAQHPGRPFTRDQILAEVWDCNFSEYESAVNSLVMRLRKKMEPDLTSPRYIRTVRGVGYRFAEDSELEDSELVD